MNVVGIDPGLTGALAAIDVQGAVLLVADLPVHHFTIGRKVRAELDLASLRRWCRTRSTTSSLKRSLPDRIKV